jgi:hypothetical protein
MAGIHRAVTLEGLIMLSRISIRQDLRIPGGFGELVGESFRLFAVITDSRRSITRKNLIGDIDALMLQLGEDPAAYMPAANTPPANTPLTDAPLASSETPAADSGTPVADAVAEGAPAEAPVLKQRTTPAGFIVLALAVVLSWLPLIFMLTLLLRNSPA